MNRMVNYRLSIALTIFCGALLLNSIPGFSQGTPNIIWQRQFNSDRINSVIFSPDGQTLISGSSDRLINLWRVSDGTLLQTLNTNATKVHESSIEWLAISPDGSRLASCNYRMVKLWRLPSGAEQQLTGHTDWVVGVAFAPGGTYLASASFDGTVKIWRGSDGALVKTINIGSGEVRSVSFSPNGQYLASGGGDGAVRIWQTSDWSLVRTLTGHTSDIYVLTFSPDGSNLASGGYDHTVKVWNTSTWANRYTITTGGNVYALAFSRDSAQLGLSDGEANHIQLHRVSDGALLKRFDQQVSNVQSIAFGQSGVIGYGRADATVVLASTSGSTSNPPPSTTPKTNPPPVVTPPPANVSQNILWQHAAGPLWEWALNGTNLVTSGKFNNGKAPAPVWRAMALGDFDSDGESDVLWQHASGAVSVWFMNGGVMQGSSPIRDGTRIQAAWRVAGVGDFNNDGQPDILFQTANRLVRVWLMQGTEVTESVRLFDGEPLARGWKVANVGDFNRDGNADLVLQNTHGDLEIQLMNGIEPANLVPMFTGVTSGVGWRVASTGDFNADGQTDLLMQNGNRFIAVWFLSGTRFSKAVYLNEGKRINPNWRAFGVTQ